MEKLSLVYVPEFDILTIDRTKEIQYKTVLVKNTSRLRQRYLYTPNNEYAPQNWGGNKVLGRWQNNCNYGQRNGFFCDWPANFIRP